MQHPTSKIYIKKTKLYFQAFVKTRSNLTFKRTVYTGLVITSPHTNKIIGHFLNKDELRLVLACPRRARSIRFRLGPQPLPVAVGCRKGRPSSDTTFHAVALASPTEVLVQGLGFAAHANSLTWITLKKNYNYLLQQILILSKVEDGLG